MFVSVIIPNYNNSNYLKSCIESVIGQKYIKEIIIVDDHSTDTSWEIITDYQKQYSDLIKIFTNPNKGVQSARNYGLTQASGKYIQWLDSDDILHHKKFKTQVEILESSKSKTIVFCDWQHFSNEKDIPLFDKSNRWKSYTNPLEWLMYSWETGLMLQTACWLTPKEICDQITWDEKIVKNQDGVYFFDALQYCFELKYVNDTIVHYRLPNSTNISRKKNYKAIRSLLDSYIHYEEIFDKDCSLRVKKSLACNYANFIKYIYPEYNDLQNKAFNRIESLGIKKAPLIGGDKFKKIQKLFGLKNAIKLIHFKEKHFT